MKQQAITQHYYKETDYYIQLVTEDKEAAEVAKLNRWMDQVGWTFAIITGLAFLTVVVAQLGIRFGW
jgi:uncharacterized membrane protein